MSEVQASFPSGAQEGMVDLPFQLGAGGESTNFSNWKLWTGVEACSNQLLPTELADAEP